MSPLTPLATFTIDSVTPPDSASAQTLPSDIPWWKTKRGEPSNPHSMDRGEAVWASGYRGIWFALGWSFEYGDKYSGGLGTYTSCHVPMAQYVAEVHRTYFTYGGTPDPARRLLTICVGCFDHATGRVSRPVTLYCDPAVDDPHDNASLHVDSEGHIWVFKSGRGTKRPGLIFRSERPHDLGSFILYSPWEFTYPQIWTGDRGKGMFLFLTRYFPGTRFGPARHLFWSSSPDGREWSEPRPLATFGGHYQTTGRWTAPDGRVTFSTFFNYHPESNVDRRTNLYYAQTVDGGNHWTTADGTPLTLPLEHPQNPALVLPLEREGCFMYNCDLNFDADGHPLLLCVISRAGEPGPKGTPREWTLLRWNGERWDRKVLATSDHNYDMGSLYVQGDLWRVMGPTGAAPQPWGTGGEIEMHESRDAGEHWDLPRAVTRGSRFNHSYVRRPLNAHPDFAAFWADGDPYALSPSRLYVSNADGSKVWRLPEVMEEDSAFPEEMPV